MDSHLNPSSPDHTLLSCLSLPKSSLLLFLLVSLRFKIRHYALLHNPLPHLVVLPRIHTSLSVMDSPLAILPSLMILLYHVTHRPPFLHPPIYFVLYMIQNSLSLVVIRNITSCFYTLYILFSYH